MLPRAGLKTAVALDRFAGSFGETVNSHSAHVVSCDVLIIVISWLDGIWEVTMTAVIQHIMSPAMSDHRLFPGKGGGGG